MQPQINVHSPDLFLAHDAQGELLRIGEGELLRNVRGFFPHIGISQVLLREIMWPLTAMKLVDADTHIGSICFGWHCTQSHYRYLSVGP